MRFSFQKTFTLLVGLCVLLLGGWVMNLLKLIASGDLHSHAGMTLARVVGGISGAGWRHPRIFLTLNGFIVYLNNLFNHLTNREKHMLGFLKKKTRKAVVEVKKMENRDAVEATVWGAYMIAYADGNCDAKEIAILEKTISALPAFSPFAGEIAQMSSNIRARYEASPRSANAQALRELADVAGTPEAVDVLCLCLDIADQDGIGEEEEVVLKKIAQALQLSLDAYI